MKILHLFSNWKWTGPAEPALNLCLAQKNMGHNASFACGAAPKGFENIVAAKAAERGLSAITRFNLKKHFRVARNLSDIFRLGKFIQNEGFDVVHTHLPNDHLIGALAARRSSKNVLLVRTCYSGEPLRRSIRNSYLLKKCADGLITVSESGKAGNIARFLLNNERVIKVDGAVDLVRFNPNNVKRDLKESLGIKQGDIVAGIIARVQRHRQFDMLLKATAIAVKSEPRLKLLIIGRGTNIEELAVNPVKELNIQDNVIFSGYRKDDYVDVLDCMDINIFIVPGSDGSCRAVREAMAMGKPVISSSRGILPELVVDGEAGFIVDENPIEFAGAILKLAKDCELRDKLGNSAREKALRDFDLTKQAEMVNAFYQKLSELQRV